MKHPPIFTPKAHNHLFALVDSRNLNPTDPTELSSLPDRDRSKPAQLTSHTKPLVSIWVGLGIGIIFSLAENRHVQAAATALEIANTRTLAAINPAVGSRQTLAQTDVCLAENSTPEAQVAVSLSEARLAQTHANLQKFQSDYNRHKLLASQGKVTPKQLETAKVAYDLAQLQKSSALRDCTTPKHS
jgi:hypothetical protein